MPSGECVVELWRIITYFIRLRFANEHSRDLLFVLGQVLEARIVYIGFLCRWFVRGVGGVNYD